MPGATAGGQRSPGPTGQVAARSTAAHSDSNRLRVRPTTTTRSAATVPGRPPSPRTACRRGALPGARSAADRVVGARRSQVVAADALDRQDPPSCASSAARACGPRAHRRPTRAVPGPGQVQRRAAAGQRPAGRGSAGPAGSAYSTRAGGAHREAGHEWSPPGVGQRGDDGEPGPQLVQLMNAVPVPPVGRVAQFGDAVGADGDIGQEARVREPPRCGERGGDDETGAAAQGSPW